MSEPPFDRKLTPWKGFMGVFTAVFVTILGLSLVITLLMPKSYRGVARVRLDTAAQFRIFGSDAVLTNTIARLDLRRGFAARYGETNPLPLDRTLDILLRSVNFKRRWSGDSPMVEIQSYSLKPEEAARIANGIAEAGCVEAHIQTQHNGSPIIDLALPATKPARPNWILNLGLGAIVGLVLGIMAGGVGARVAVGLGKDLPQNPPNAASN